jgi:hypothetical protein
VLGAWLGLRLGGLVGSWGQTAGIEGNLGYSAVLVHALGVQPDCCNGPGMPSGCLTTEGGTEGTREGPRVGLLLGTPVGGCKAHGRFDRYP